MKVNNKIANLVGYLKTPQMEVICAERKLGQEHKTPIIYELKIKCKAKHFQNGR